MIKLLIPVVATIAGIFLIQLANGFLGTLVAIRTVDLGFAPLLTSVVLASYYAGYTFGAATIANILFRIGHIRLFAALAGLAAASIVVLPIAAAPAAWIIIRFVVGVCCAGLFITAESWLNATSRRESRGTVFAAYMVASNAAFGGGQFLINLPASGGYELFSLAAALFCLALVPVCMTHSAAPTVTASPKLKLRELRRVAPTALAGVSVSGMLSSTFYSLLPAYGQSEGMSLLVISTYMATAIFGGLTFQIPVGRLSDRYDRRLVAGAVALGLSAIALTLSIVPPSNAAIYVATFFLGGFMATIYPVCVAHANDQVAFEYAISTSGQLILVNGIASFFGPVLGTAVMGRSGIFGIFGFMATISLAFAIFALLRALYDPNRDRKARPFVILNERMSQPAAHVAEPTNQTQA